MNQMKKTNKRAFRTAWSCTLAAILTLALFAGCQETPPLESSMEADTSSGTTSDNVTATALSETTIEATASVHAATTASSEITTTEMITPTPSATTTAALSQTTRPTTNTTVTPLETTTVTATTEPTTVTSAAASTSASQPVEPKNTNTTIVSTSSTTVSDTANTTETNGAVISANISGDFQEIAEEIFRLTNEERKAAGLSLLKGHSILAECAQDRATESAVNQSVEHNRPNGDIWNTILEDYKIKTQCSWWSENLFYAPFLATGDQVVKAWTNSPGHKTNMLRTEDTHMSIGIAKGENGYYYIQEFIQLKA